MWKSIASLLVVGTMVSVVSQEASAGRRNCRYAGGYYYSSSNWATPAATVPAPAPVVAQNNNGGTTYRSYSYDPAPVAAVPAPSTAPAYIFREPTMPRAMPYMFRADRKMFGLAENPNNY